MKILTLILDRSGSMSSIWPTITKEVKNHIKKVSKSNSTLSSLLLFNTKLYYVFKNKNRLPNIDLNKFGPHGGTALIDAVMFAIENVVKDGGDFLFDTNVEVEFCVFTDGEENSSVVNQENDIRRAISYFQDNYNWKFSFIGSGDNDTVKRYATSLGFKADNTIGYTSTEDLKGIFSKVA